MKKSTITLIISAVVISLLYLCTAIFTLGTIWSPSNTQAWVTDGNPSGADGQNSYVTIDLPDNPGIAKIYAFVGEVDTATQKESVLINFDFKTRSDRDGNSQYYNERIVSKIPVKYGTGGYSWIKVFDSKELDRAVINYERVKINTPDCFYFHEVAFIDKDGKLIGVKISDNIKTEEEKIRSNLLIDEQESFTSSESKKFYFTDEELKNLSAVNSLANGNGIEIGSGPLSVTLDFISTAIFGKNTFGMRFFDFVSGYIMLIVAFLFANRLFGHNRYGLITSLCALALGSVFSASTFAFGLEGGLFTVLGLFFASRYFIRHFYLQNVKKAVSCLAISGLFFALALASNMGYAITVVGYVALFIMAFIRGYKQYKKEEKEAEGLQKEEVFLAYRKKKIISVLTAIVSFVIIPIVMFIIFYAICSKSYTAYFGESFFGSATEYFKLATTPVYESNPFALFVGFGGQKINGYYSFLNYVVSILGLSSLVFVIIAIAFGKKIAFFADLPSVPNRFKIAIVSFLTVTLTVFTGVNSSVCGFASVSIFYCVFIAFADYILSKCIKNGSAKVISNVCVIVSLIVFAMAFVGYVGIALPEIVNKILYLWQVL